MLAGARRFHRRVQRQNVGLERNGVDQVDNVGHPVRRFVNQAHFAGHLLHHLAVVFNHRGGIGRKVGRFPGMRGGIFHRRGDLLHRGGGLFYRTCLLFRARGQILVPGDNLRGCAGDILRAGLHLLHDVQQSRFHLHQRMQQQTRFVFAVWRDAAREIALRNGFCKMHRLAERTSDSAHDKPANQAACRNAKEREQDQQQSVRPEIPFHLRAGTLHLAVLNGNQLLHLRFISLLHGEGGGHHLLNSASTVVVLHRLQDAVARVQVLLAHAADIRQHLLGLMILQHVVQLAQNHRDMLANLFQVLLRLPRVGPLLVQQHQLLSANKFLEIIN